MIGDDKSKKSKKVKKFSPFKSEAEERAWRHAHMLTVGKLVAWLQQYDQDALVYAIEPNTNTWQEISYDANDTTHIGGVFSTLEAQQKDEFDNLQHWYAGTKNAKQNAQKMLDEAFQYVEKHGICVI